MTDKKDAQQALLDAERRFRLLGLGRRLSGSRIRLRSAATRRLAALRFRVHPLRAVAPVVRQRVVGLRRPLARLRRPIQIRRWRLFRRPAYRTFEPRLDKPNWVIVDHHNTDCSPKNAQLVHDVNKSAGLLCYELCQQHELGSTKLDRLVYLNNVADLFLDDDPDFVLASDYANLVKTYQFWNLEALIHGNPEMLLDHPLLEVMAVKRRIEDPLGFAWTKSNITELSPSVGLANTVIGNTNQVVHQLLEQRATTYPVLITLFRRGNGMILASLRSRTGEALKVAEKLQGGGHANACGATLPRSIQNIPDAIAYLRQVLNPAPARGAPLNSLESLFAAIELAKK